MGPHIETYFLFPHDPRALKAVAALLPDGQRDYFQLLTLQPSKSRAPDAPFVRACLWKPSSQFAPIVMPHDLEIPHGLLAEIGANPDLKALEITNDFELKLLAHLSNQVGTAVSYVYHHGWKGLREEYAIGGGPPFLCFFNTQEYRGNPDQGAPNSAFTAALWHIGVPAANQNEGEQNQITSRKYSLFPADGTIGEPLDLQPFAKALEEVGAAAALERFIADHHWFLDYSYLEHLIYDGSPTVRIAASAAMKLRDRPH